MQRLDGDIKLAQRGDKEAFIRLIKVMELSMYGIARAIVKRDEDCSDAIQETILKAYRSIGKLKEPAFFKTWLYRILINECNQILRRERKVVLDDFLMTTTSAHDKYENIDLKEAIGALDETLKLLVTLHYFEDLPLKKIAELLETPEGTIKSRLHRARSLLADYLNPPNERKLSYE